MQMAESWQQTGDQSMDAAGEETSGDAEQADQSWEDNSNQDWDYKKNNGWEDRKGWRDKREERPADYVDPRDEDVFILQLEKQKALKIIGSRGGMVKEIGKQSRAFIKIDPDAEPASVRIAGSVTAVDRARAMISDILTSEHNKPRPGEWSDEMFRKVTKDESAKIIGSRGSNISYIEKKTWAKLDVGNEEHGGVVLVRVTGDFDAVDNALQMISDVLNNKGDWAKDWGDSGGGGRKRKRFQDGEEPEATATMQFEASFSGSIIGKSGAAIKKLREESGAEVDCQKIENDSKCEVTMKGSAEEVELAKKLVAELVEQIKAKRAPREGAATEILEFEKKAAKHIIGPKGSHIKEVRETSNADVKVNDDYNKCIVTIHGSPEQIQIAKQKIEELAGGGQIDNRRSDDWKSNSWNKDSDNSWNKDSDSSWNNQSDSSWNRDSDNSWSNGSNNADGNNRYQSGNSDNWNNKSDSMDLGSAATVIGVAAAKGPPSVPKAPLLQAAVMKAPGGPPNTSWAPPKFGGLDALCDNLQSGPISDSWEPENAAQVMGAALAKAPAKAHTVPARFGGSQAKGNGKGGKFEPNPSFTQPGNPDSWDNSEDWQSGDAHQWQEEQPAAPSFVPARAAAPMKVPPRPAGPNFAFTQPAADDWAAGGGDSWQSESTGDFNSGPGNAFTGPAATDDWGQAPVEQAPSWLEPQPMQQQQQPLQQLQQQPPQQQPKFSWLQEEQPAVQMPPQKPKFSWLQGEEQPAAQQPSQQWSAPQAPPQQQFSWLQSQEQQPSVQQQMMPSEGMQQFSADAEPSWGGWMM